MISTTMLKPRCKPAEHAYPAPDDHALLARRLDREADAELFAGHHLRAEYLAQQAFALRAEAS